MLRRFKVNVDGHEYAVTVEEMSETAGNLYPDSAAIASASAQAGQGARAAPPPAASPAKPEAGPGDVVSPLAGLVLSIEVEVGGSVTTDTLVVTLEAMKTKTIVAAGRSGEVKAVAVRVGDSVEAGQALLTIA